MNTCQLLGYYGGDKEHAMSAWTSTTRDYEKKKERMPQLLQMLAREGHHTPFEKSSLHFLVNTDIATHIHILKHRVGVAVNAESARYKEIREDKYYLPKDWDGVPFERDAKDGICYMSNGNTYLPADSVGEILYGNEKSWAAILEEFNNVANTLYHEALRQLTPVLGRKRAKETARFFKTYNSQITSDVMFNWRSFAHFQKLRNSKHAQVEVREIAEEMLRLVKEIPDNPFKETIEAFEL